MIIQDKSFVFHGGLLDTLSLHRHLGSSLPVDMANTYARRVSDGRGKFLLTFACSRMHRPKTPKSPLPKTPLEILFLVVDCLFYGVCFLGVCVDPEINAQQKGGKEKIAMCVSTCRENTSRRWSRPSGRVGSGWIKRLDFTFIKKSTRV